MDAGDGTYTQEDLELRLTLEFRVRRTEKTWFKDKKYLGAVVEALAEQPLFGDLTVAGRWDRTKPFESLAQAKSLVAIGRAVDTSLESPTKDDATSDLRVVLQPRAEAFSLLIFCKGAVLAKHRKTILEQFVALSIRVREALADVAGIFTGYATPWFAPLSTGDWVYPRPRPPRTHPGVPIHSVVDVIDLRFHTSKHPEVEPEPARALATAKAPTAVRRHAKDDLVVIQWAKDATLAELQRAASEHEVWFSAQVETLLDDGFNELGDRIEKARNAQPAPPLTLYSPKWRVGYKTVVVFPDGSVDKSAWNAAKKVVKTKATEDGSLVDEVMIIVPKRDLVFVVAERAKEAGFAAVLYPGDDGTFWNPDPPGLWRTPAPR